MMGDDEIMKNSSKRVLSLLTAVVFWISLFAGYPIQFVHAEEGTDTSVSIAYPMPSITPPPVHPRLFLRSEDIPVIKKNMTQGRVAKAWEKMQERANEVTGLLPQDSKDNYSEPVLTAIQANALKYAVDKDGIAGQRAVEAITNFMNTVKFKSGGDVTRDIGFTIMTVSIVYDWCYDIMKDEHRALFREKMKKFASTMEIGYPPVKQGAITGHGSEDQIMRDLISAGIATFDEDPSIYQWTAGRFFADFIEPRNYYYQGGMVHQGDSYGPERFRREIIAAWIFKRMVGGDVFSADQGKVPYHWIYARRPDGQLLRDGDTFESKWKKVGEYWAHGNEDMMVANYYKDPYNLFEYLKGLKYGGQADELWTVLFDDPNFESGKPHTELPLTRYFEHPYGTMIARTGWQDGMTSGDVVAEMKIGGYYFGNHAHFDAGKFQIYYKGSLAADSGVYDEYNSQHHKNYHRRTIAHNSMLVYDPDETFIYQNKQVANDGGQRISNGGNEPKDMNMWMDPASGYEVAKVLSRKFGPDEKVPEFSYLKGDLTKAYSSKIEDFKRSFVFLNLKNQEHPAALIVFDKVTAANPDFKKTWLLHSLEEPQIVGNTATVTKTGYEYNGKLVNQTILPASDNLSLIKVGGTGKEYLVGEENQALSPKKKFDLDTYEAGAWRIEVSPKNASRTDVFLNVIQVMDNVGGPQPLQTQKVKGDSVTGVKIADRVVLFAENGELMKDKASFKVEGSEARLSYLATDLNAGLWTVEKDGKVVGQYEVQEAENVLYFSGGAGEYTLKYAGEITAAYLANSKVKTLVYEDNFSKDTKDWTLEGFGNYSIKDGKLYLNDPDAQKAGTTLWLKKEFEGDMVITYDCEAVGPDLGKNLNFFFHSRTMDDRNVLTGNFPGTLPQYQRNLKGYLFTFTGVYPGDPTLIGHSRLRKYPGNIGLSEDMDSKVALNKKYSVEIIKVGKHIEIKVDGKTIHQVVDEDAYNSGSMGFRTWKTNTVFDNFRVYSVNTAVNVKVDGKDIKSEIPARIIGGRTLVPVRGVLEALGLKVDWDDAKKTVTAANERVKIVLPIGSKAPTVSGKVLEIDVPAQVIGDTTFVPLRFIAESAGCKVEWDNVTHTASIISSAAAK